MTPDPQAAPLSAEECSTGKGGFTLAHLDAALTLLQSPSASAAVAELIADKARAEAAESALTAPDVSAAKVEGVSSAPTDTAAQSFPLRLDTSIPNGEIHIKHSDGRVDKIVNIGEAAQEKETKL